MGIQEELKTLSDKIKQYRDEARVQLHLARQDVKDEFDELEHEWDKFRTRFDQVSWRRTENGLRKHSQQNEVKTLSR